LFFASDGNRDNTLTFSEFQRGVAMLGIRPAVEEADLRKIFAVLDVDGSGKIDWEELQSWGQLDTPHFHGRARAWDSSDVGVLRRVPRSKQQKKIIPCRNISKASQRTSMTNAMSSLTVLDSIEKKTRQLNNQEGRLRGKALEIERKLSTLSKHRADLQLAKEEASLRMQLERDEAIAEADVKKALLCNLYDLDAQLRTDVASMEAFRSQLAQKMDALAKKSRDAADKIAELKESHKRARADLRRRAALETREACARLHGEFDQKINQLREDARNPVRDKDTFRDAQSNPEDDQSD
jgi:hypothetical protein